VRDLQAAPPLTEFNRRRAAVDGLQSRCRDCSRAWYLENRDEHKKNVRLRNQRVRDDYRQRLGAYLLTHPCVDCGETDLRVLDFDHDDPSQKLDEVVRLAGFGIAWKRVEAEIAKCSVRCANCHRRRTAEMFGYWREGAEGRRLGAMRERASARLPHVVGG
jgi:hypothetical protein